MDKKTAFTLLLALAVLAAAAAIEFRYRKPPAPPPSLESMADRRLEDKVQFRRLSAGPGSEEPYPCGPGPRFAPLCAEIQRNAEVVISLTSQLRAMTAQHAQTDDFQASAPAREALLRELERSWERTGVPLKKLETLREEHKYGLALHALTRLKKTRGEASTSAEAKEIAGIDLFVGKVKGIFGVSFDSAAQEQEVFRACMARSEYLRTQKLARRISRISALLTLVLSAAWLLKKSW